MRPHKHHSPTHATGALDVIASSPNRTDTRSRVRSGRGRHRACRRNYPHRRLQVPMVLLTSTLPDPQPVWCKPTIWEPLNKLLMTNRCFLRPPECLPVEFRYAPNIASDVRYLVVHGPHYSPYLSPDLRRRRRHRKVKEMVREPMPPKHRRPAFKHAEEMSVVAVDAGGQ